MNNLNQLADDFCHAFYERRWPGGDAPEITGLSQADSYRVQDLVAEKRIAKGESVAGFKVGCTSAAIRQQFNLEEPIHGRLFYPHVRQSCQDVDWTKFVNCAIEPEMVLRIGSDLHDNCLSDEQLIDSIEYISPGIELHNFRFWLMPPTTQELICSGGIHAGLIIGDAKVDPKSLNFRSEMFSVFKAGQEAASAPAADIMGGPLHSLRWLVKSLTEKGSVLKKGSYVIPGSPVELVPVDADTQLRIRIEDVGDLTIRFRRNRSIARGS